MGVLKNKNKKNGKGAERVPSDTSGAPLFTFLEVCRMLLAFNKSIPSFTVTRFFTGVMISLSRVLRLVTKSSGVVDFGDMKHGKNTWWAVIQEIFKKLGLIFFDVCVCVFGWLLICFAIFDGVEWQKIFKIECLTRKKIGGSHHNIPQRMRGQTFNREPYQPYQPLGPENQRPPAIQGSVSRLVTSPKSGWPILPPAVTGKPVKPSLLFNSSNSWHPQPAIHLDPE